MSLQAIEVPYGGGRPFSGGGGEGFTREGSVDRGNSRGRGIKFGEGPVGERKSSVVGDRKNSVVGDRKSSVVGDRKSSVVGGDRRRSSLNDGGTSSRRVSLFMDYEATTKAFLDAQVKLSNSGRVLSELEARHSELKQSFDALGRRFVEVQRDALECTLIYSLEKSGEFKHFPRYNPDLLETEMRVGEYLLGEIINRGRFSVVKRCTKNPALLQLGNGSPTTRKHSLATLTYGLAVKAIPTVNLTSILSVLSIENELRALKEMQQHPNILSIKESLHGAQNVYIITDAVEFDLFEFLESYQSLINDNIVGVILREIAAGLAHLHAHRIVHCDIKSENVLVEFTSHASRHNQIIVKIADFGLCKFVSDTSSMLSEFSGSPGFFAPEALVHSAYCGFRADVYSVGSIALELLVSQVSTDTDGRLVIGTIPTRFDPLLCLVISGVLVGSQTLLIPSSCHHSP